MMGVFGLFKKLTFAVNTRYSEVTGQPMPDANAAAANPKPSAGSAPGKPAANTKPGVREGAQ